MSGARLPKKTIAFEREFETKKRGDNHHLNVEAGKLESKYWDPEIEMAISHSSFNFIFIFLAGEMHVQIGADNHQLKSGSLVVVPENILVAFRKIRDCKGSYIHFSTESLLPQTSSTGLAEAFPFLDFESDHVFHPEAAMSAIIQQSFCDILREFERFSSEKVNLLRDYIHILLLRIRELPQSKLQKEGQLTFRTLALANRFKRLLEKRFIDIHQVHEYASILNVTPKYLCESVKEVFGRRPREMVQSLLVQEAKALLKATDLTVSQIASILNFEDQSYFGRFIKQHTGISPQQWRNKS